MTLVLLEPRRETAGPPLAIDLASEDLASAAETWTTLPCLGETAFSDGGLRRGTDYLHARFRSPLTGRFLSTDPIGGDPKAPQSWNRFAYVLGNPLKYVDPDGLEEAEVTCDADGCSTTVIGEDPGAVDLAFLLALEEFRNEFAAFREHSLSTRVGHRDFNRGGMSFQQHVDLGVLMGQGGDCADPNCLMMAQVVYDFENSALLWTIGSSQAAGLGFMGAVEAASVAGPAAANAGLGPGRFLFGRGGAPE